MTERKKGCIYKDVDDNFFSKIDTEEKAYLLGWIAADGSINKSGFNIYIHKKDIKTLTKLKNIISKQSPLKKINLVGFTINSRKISEDLMKLFKITDYNKSKEISVPEIDDKLFYHMIRGWFDGDGSIRKCSIDRTIDCKISSISEKVKETIKEKINIPCSINKEQVSWSGNNALDFLGKIYEGANVFLDRKELQYREWAEFKKVNFYGHKIKESGFSIFKWKRENKNSAAPFKERVSDSGYDLTVIEKIKTIGRVELYDTGIIVQPEFGYYFDLVPRSSIIKSGYMLANGVGIIDRTYQGTIKVPLIKIDENAKDLTLPNRIVQLIPREIIHAKFKEVESFDLTSRAEGGFGSSGNNTGTK